MMMSQPVLKPLCLQALLRNLLLLAFTLTLVGIAPTLSAQDDEAESARPLFIAHYMPWYQTPEVSGYWGWHWTMDHFDPSQIDENSRPNIASHYTPLTGPYDSKDVAVLEYQVLLMKLSGIDGVVVDWYGIEPFWDYGTINDATIALFEMVKKAGLKFALAYEDATVKNMVNENHIKGEDALAHGQSVMQFVDENWFTDEAYLRHQEQPLLFVFGPQYFRQPTDWETMFSDLSTDPALITLDGHMDWAALAGYPWPPMHMAGGATLAPAALQAYLDMFYRNAHRKDFIVGGAFPAFHDIYEEAGVRSSYGYLDPADGETFRTTLNLALENDANIVQLITWNDYGEGTIIEPTHETGYQYLGIVQETSRTLRGNDFSFTPDDLTLPLRLYNLRKAYAADVDVQARLDEAFAAIIAGDLATAVSILEEL